jgi:hypothetical protein
LFGGLAVWAYRAVYPRFETHPDPGGYYAAAFPTPPDWEWSPGGRAGERPASDAVATRVVGFWPEVYRVRVTRTGLAARGSAGGTALALASRTYPAARVTRPVPGGGGGDGAAEFEKREADTRYRLVGRVVVAGGYVYELTVSGRNLSLDDWRVRTFFDSFRAYR